MKLTDKQITAIQKNLGKDINSGDLVVYFSTGQVVSHPTKKWAFLVTSLEPTSSRVTLKNTVNKYVKKEDFETDLASCVNIEVLHKLGLINLDNFSHETLESILKHLRGIEKDKKIKVELQSRQQGKTKRFFDIESYPYRKVKDDMMDASCYSIDNKRYTTKYDEVMFIEPKPKEIKMKKVLDKNVDASKIAAKVVAGEALNKAIMKRLKKSMPVYARGYLKTPLAKVALANAVSFAVSNFANDNDKAKYVAEAMMEAAYVTMVKSFNIDKIITEVLSSTNIEIPED